MQRSIKLASVIFLMSIIACSGDIHAPKPLICPGLQQNIADLAIMMKDLHALMHEGPFTEKQATEISTMMIQVSFMMKEMSGPEGERLAPQNEQKLKAMCQRLEIIRQQIKSQNQP